MTEQERLEIEHHCARLVTQFCIYNDQFDSEAVANLFAEDAVWDHMVAGRLEGRNAIREYLQRKDSSALIAHVVTNILTDVVDENNANGKSYFTFYAAPSRSVLPAELKGPMIIGAYDDKFVRTGHGWKFLYRAKTQIWFQAKFRDEYTLFKQDDALKK